MFAPTANALDGNRFLGGAEGGDGGIGHKCLRHKAEKYPLLTFDSTCIIYV